MPKTLLETIVDFGRVVVTPLGMRVLDGLIRAAQDGRGWVADTGETTYTPIAGSTGQDDLELRSSSCEYQVSFSY
jgi:hypothetical protein